MKKQKHYGNKTGLVLLGLAVLPFTANFLPPEMISPCVGDCTYQVYASEVEQVVSEVVIPASETSYSTDIEKYIYEVFGEDAEDAIKIGTCESGLKADRVGDTHIMGELNGEMIGDSVGLFQIRTGNAAGVYDKSSWNRAKANGMTVEEFRTKLKDPKYNIDYAKSIYDRQGWSAWFNCMKKTGVN